MTTQRPTNREPDLTESDPTELAARIFLRRTDYYFGATTKVVILGILHRKSSGVYQFRTSVLVH